MATKFVNIRGDWLRDGAFLEGRGTLRIGISEDRAYELDRDGRVETRDPPLRVDVDGNLAHGDAAAMFSPDAGEIDRLQSLHGPIFDDRH